MLSTKLKEAAGNSADATLYVDDVFSTYLYTGNGSTQTITNGIDLATKGGAVFFGGRNIGTNKSVYDTARGATFDICTNLTQQQFARTTALTGFTSSGFTLGADAATEAVNLNGTTYASWTFRKAEKFFDVVTYTGTGSARTIAHSLGVAPGMVIVKRTDTTGDWQVYSNGLTSAAYSIQLNLTNAQASAPTVWNSTAPTSSVFSVGTDATVNASGGTYVAYLFAHDTSSTGIIQCGSFTADGSGNATVNLGWEPQWILIKNTTFGSSFWTIQDVMRGMPDDRNVPNSKRLFPNTSGAESDYGAVSPTSTGFISGGHASGDNLIYMAIRMPNKPPTTGTQVFAPVAYSGNDTARNLPTGFVADAALVMPRNAAGNTFYFSDRLRGASQVLQTQSTAAEISAGGYMALDVNNGVNLLSSTYNASPYTFELECFKRAPGFFDEVCYTGTGTTQNIFHNLTVAPELIINKSRSTDVNSGWPVYAAPLGNNKVMRLNFDTGSGASGGWDNTSPTTTQFTVNGYNNSGVTYVAYLFATLAGISKVGSYTGNGTGQAIACGFSAGARFVLIKRTDSTGDWYTFDSARGLTSGSSPYLLLNSTAAETTGNNGVYASTGGFTLGSTASTTTNINAATYIFLAVA